MRPISGFPSGPVPGRWVLIRHPVPVHKMSVRDVSGSLRPRQGLHVAGWLSSSEVNERERAGREAKLERLILGSNDMGDVVAAAMSLREPARVMGRLRRVVLTGMFASYARAFNTSRGDGDLLPLPTAPTKGMSSEDRRIHTWAIGERDNSWVHLDRSQHRRETDVQEGAENVLGFVERFEPPSTDEIEALRELAGRLQDRYVAEAEELWRSLEAED